MGLDEPGVPTAERAHQSLLELLEPAAREISVRQLGRLPWTRREADAIAAEIPAGKILAAWLLMTPEAFSPRGRVTLWVIAVIVIGLGLIETAQRKPS